MKQVLSRREPPLLIGNHSEALLRGIARAAMRHAPEVASRLLGEVDRADVVSENDVPYNAVRLGSFVTYRVRLTGAINTVRLMRPHEADLRKSRVSIISDIGVALIGLQSGQQIEWDFGGQHHVLEVLRVNTEP